MRTNIALSGLMLCAALTGVALTSTGCAGNSYKRSTGTYLDDKGITARVKTALFRDPAVSGFDVHVNTFRGDVQLSGFVDTPEQKDRAAEIARTIDGVRLVTNNLDVKPGAVGRPGAAVQGETRTMTAPSPADYNYNTTPPPTAPAPVYTPNPAAQPPPVAALQNSGPDVRAPFHPKVDIQTDDNGRATIRGTVATEGDKRSIEKKVRSIPGIRDVDNELDVLRPR